MTQDRPSQPMPSNPMPSNSEPMVTPAGRPTRPPIPEPISKTALLPVTESVAPTQSATKNWSVLLGVVAFVALMGGLGVAWLHRAVPAPVSPQAVIPSNTSSSNYNGQSVAAGSLGAPTVPEHDSAPIQQPTKPQTIVLDKSMEGANVPTAQSVDNTPPVIPTAPVVAAPHIPSSTFSTPHYTPATAQPAHTAPASQPTTAARSASSTATPNNPVSPALVTDQSQTESPTTTAPTTTDAAPPVTPAEQPQSTPQSTPQSSQATSHTPGAVTPAGAVTTTTIMSSPAHTATHTEPLSTSQANAQALNQAAGHIIVKPVTVSEPTPASQPPTGQTSGVTAAGAETDTGATITPSPSGVVPTTGPETTDPAPSDASDNPGTSPTTDNPTERPNTP